MNDVRYVALYVLIACLVLTVVTVGRIHNYKECRAHGLSKFYCATALR